MSGKSKKASLGMLIAALIQIAAIVCANYGIMIPEATVQLLIGGAIGLSGMTIAGHALTDITNIKKNGGNTNGS